MILVCRLRPVCLSITILGDRMNVIRGWSFDVLTLKRMDNPNYCTLVFSSANGTIGSLTTDQDGNLLWTNSRTGNTTQLTNQ